mgnify:CR=1 FL=1
MLSRNNQEKITLPTFSITFPVALYRPNISCHSKYGQDTQLGKQLRKTTAAKVYRTHHLYKIPQRIDTGNPLRPFGHTMDRRKKPAQQNKYKHKEPHNEHGLL